MIKMSKMMKNSSSQRNIWPLRERFVPIGNNRLSNQHRRRSVERLAGLPRAPRKATRAAGREEKYEQVSNGRPKKKPNVESYWEPLVMTEDQESNATNEGAEAHWDRLTIGIWIDPWKIVWDRTILLAKNVGR
jgi:hypothetical protein